MSRKFIVGITAACLLVTVAWGVLATTTRAVPSPPCEHCGATNGKVATAHDDSTVYKCSACGKTFGGPARSDFSWIQAVEFWLSDE